MSGLAGKGMLEGQGVDVAPAPLTHGLVGLGLGQVVQGGHQGPPDHLVQPLLDRGVPVVKKGRAVVQPVVHGPAGHVAQLEVGLGQLAQVVLERLLEEVDKGQLEDGRRRAVRGQVLVPGLEQGQGLFLPLGGGGVLIGFLDERDQPLGGQGADVQVDGPHVRRGQLVLGGQELPDPGDPVRVGPVERNVVGILRADGLVVGRGDEALGRVEQLGVLAEKGR